MSTKSATRMSPCRRVAVSPRVVDFQLFYLDQKPIKKSPDPGTAPLKGWYQEHTR